MTDYNLYYWPIPFRGHFVRYVLAHVGAPYTEPDTDALIGLKSQAAADQPLPLMAPPILHDRNRDVWLSQLPAILMYLGRQHDLLPGDAVGDALTLKVICDCNDVLEELTCHCGASMWSQEQWDTFAAGRLIRWMEIFEATGHRHGLTDSAGHLLGTAAPSLADLATAALWFTMIDKLPPLAPILDRHAPAVASLSRRIADLPEIAALRARHDAQNGDAYCGGQIERSLHSVLGL